jgi:hypothetical protein
MDDEEDNNKDNDTEADRSWN